MDRIESGMVQIWLGGALSPVGESNGCGKHIVGAFVTCLEHLLEVGGSSGSGVIWVGCPFDRPAR
jgi:hypothetical protein